MRKNKFVKVLEGILLSLPLLYVGVTCLYVSNNKNAKDSYYGENINDYQVIQKTDNVVDSNEIYYLDSNYTIDTSLTGFIYAYDVEIVEYGNLSTQIINQLTSRADESLRMSFALRGSNSNRYSVEFNYYDGGYNYLTLIYLDTYNFIISFKATSWTNALSSYVTYREYNNYSFLNNALPYSMSEFNKLGFNKIPFTSFFTNIFHNGETNVYIDFLNSYLNYMLLVECTYVVPMVLYWFIHIGENILERFTHKEF